MATSSPDPNCDNTTTTTTKHTPPKMEIQRALIDRQFDRYVLSTEGVQKHEALLPAAVLEALNAAKTTRKSQWDARVHSNALAADPFASGEAGGCSAAYFVDANFRVMQLVWQQTTGLKIESIYQLPPSQQRSENLSLQVAGRGVIVVSDGNGTLRILKNSSTAWECVDEFQPIHGRSVLLLKASYDEAAQCIDAVLAEPLDGSDKEASFRLWLVRTSSPAAADSMDVDSGAAGLEHTVKELLVASTLPDYVSFTGNELALLVEGSYNLVITSPAAPVAPAAPAAVTDTHHVPKRHHEDTEDDMDVDDVLSKVPRAGIGYHGDVSDVKHAHELAHDIDFSVPLHERFRKSSIPYSSLDEPLHSTSSEAVRSPSSQGRVGDLEVPTPDTILGGFEECDDMDPNAKVAILLINTDQLAVQDKLDVNCRSFRYLGKGAAPSSLLFQNDVHGLVFTLSIVASRLKLAHTGTFPAFGFVQASKEDKKYLTFDARFAVIGEFERRVFVYHGAQPGQEKDTHVLEQNVVEVGDHQLLGMYVAGSAILLLTPHHAYAISVNSL